MKGLGLKINRTVIISSILLITLIYHLITNSQTTIQSKRNGDLYPITQDNIAKGSASSSATGNGSGNGSGNLHLETTPFMPKMENATLKAELGRSTWKLFHTILGRYPENPNENERKQLNTFIGSLAQVYPCGDCARHFIKVLNENPPQLNSRKNAAMWGCYVHNIVNRRLGKEIYDCTTILDDYDCGCGEDTNEFDDLEIKESRDHLDSIKIETVEERVGG